MSSPLLTRRLVAVLVLAGIGMLLTGVERANTASIRRRHHRASRQLINTGHTGSSSNNVFLLISTSSKIYIVRMPNVASTATPFQPINLTSGSGASGSGDYEVIHEEAYAHSWITDALYVASERLVYVNVYNSSKVSSDIFTLGYDAQRGTWTRRVLYRDHLYCLGIAYNERRRELYWTTLKAIMSASTLENEEEEARGVAVAPRVAFALDMAKKLLYVKYDELADRIYVSTLNYVYSCSFAAAATHTQPCHVIANDLQSARGLYLDAAQRDLYVVDHKRRLLKRIKLSSIVGEQDEQDEIKRETTTSGTMASSTTTATSFLFTATAIAAAALSG